MKFNQIYEQLTESLGEQPIFVHDRSAYNKWVQVRNAKLISNETMEVYLEDGTKTVLNIKAPNPNYKIMLNDGSFTDATTLAAVYGLLQPDTIVNEATEGLTDIQNHVVNILVKKRFHINKIIEGLEPGTSAVLMSKRASSYETRYAEVEADGSVNGTDLKSFLKGFGESVVAESVFKCQECGKKFNKPVDECPKCGGSDIDLVTEQDVGGGSIGGGGTDVGGATAGTGGSLATSPGGDPCAHNAGSHNSAGWNTYGGFGYMRPVYLMRAEPLHGKHKKKRVEVHSRQIHKHKKHHK